MQLAPKWMFTRLVSEFVFNLELHGEDAALARAGESWSLRGAHSEVGAPHESGQPVTNLSGHLLPLRLSGNFLTRSDS